MARIARVVIPGAAHLLTQRGNRGQKVFQQEEDYRAYAGWLNESARRAGLAIWAYCLMPNHVHFLVCPQGPDSIRGAFAETHRRYTRLINRRMKWTGHLWQERFASFPLAPQHVTEIVRYVETNPVRARLVKEAGEWPWSSATDHLRNGQGSVSLDPSEAWTRDRILDWRGFLRLPPSSDRPAREEIERNYNLIRRHIRSGRPWGHSEFVSSCERATGRNLARRKPGPKPGSKRGGAAPTGATAAHYASDDPLPPELL